MVELETYCITTESIRSTITSRERIVADVGQVEIPITNCVARDAELAERIRCHLALRPIEVGRITSHHRESIRAHIPAVEEQFIRQQEADIEEAKHV